MYRPINVAHTFSSDGYFKKTQIICSYLKVTTNISSTLHLAAHHVKHAATHHHSSTLYPRGCPAVDSDSYHPNPIPHDCSAPRPVQYMGMPHNYSAPRPV